MLPIGPLSTQFVRDRAVRYLVPYLAFSSLCIVLYPFVAPDWKPVDVLGVFLASALSIKAATGFELYWFLPCFFMLTVLRALRVQLSSGAGWLLLGIAVSINAGVGWLSAEQLFYSPFGLATALFMYPLGVGAAWLWRVGRSRRTVTGAVAVAVWAACAVVLYQVDSSANVGRLRVYWIGQPVEWLIHNLIPVAAFLAFCSLAPMLTRVPGLARLGRHSLTIYLVHSLVSQALRMAFDLDPQRLGLVLGVLLLGLILAISDQFATVLERVTPLRRLIMPRDAKEWPLLRPRGSITRGS
ncbi:MAG: acyltransferase family protein [Deltaproteobacteria bacterium]|nr:acyltransferase family protein [Deltaproteobacteria bacterium]